MNENESLTVTLTLDNDEELECSVLTIFDTDEKRYIALLPLDDSGENSSGQIYLYRLIDRGEDEEPGLENILDDNEFARVSEAFNEWMEEEDFGDIDLDELYALDDAE
ncbi:MAG TPA: DUF1292 domain-containing protein [Candidatus Mediterraneibacter merdipullorum]|nr:DUF1292 domain-containing protein [Candidatus Mediterraneibacter merdipullorum]